MNVTTETTSQPGTVQAPPTRDDLGTCHNGGCGYPSRRDVLGSYCSWFCHNDDKRYEDREDYERCD